MDEFTTIRATVASFGIGLVIVVPVDGGEPLSLSCTIEQQGSLLIGEVIEADVLVGRDRSGVLNNFERVAPCDDHWGRWREWHSSLSPSQSRRTALAKVIPSEMVASGSRGGRPFAKRRAARAARRTWKPTREG